MTKNASFQRTRRFSIPVVATTPRFCDKTREWVQKLSQNKVTHLVPGTKCCLKTTYLCCSCCSVAVLERLFPYPKNTAIFIYIIIYINIGINVDFRITYFGTAALQRCNSECRVMLASTMPSASSLDEVNAATAMCSCRKKGKKSAKHS